MVKHRKRQRSSAPGVVQIANMVGVSVATVSRALNKPQMVRGDTRKKVEDAARQVGYIRYGSSPIGQQRRTGSVGMVVPTIDNAIFAEMIAAFATQLGQLDRTLLIASHGYNLDEEVSIVRSMLERRVDGIVLVGGDHDPRCFTMIKASQTPYVLTWNYTPDSSHPCVGTNNVKAGQLIAKHCLSLGHRSIGLIFPDRQNNDRARDRFDGVVETLHSAGVYVEAAHIFSSPYDLSAAKTIALTALDNSTLTAFICGNDIIAQGVVYAAQKRGITIPQDLTVLGIGDFKSSSSIEPPLSTVRIEARLIGRNTARLITNLIDHPEQVQTTRLEIFPQLKVRQSCASAKPAPATPSKNSLYA